MDLDGTVMQVEFFAGSQSLGVATQIPFEIPWVPTAPGDYALMAVATDDSGASSTSTVNTVTAVPALQLTNQMLISTGAAWNYQDNGQDPGPGWTALHHDTSSWKMGNSKLGYGEGDEATVVSFGPNAADKYLTTWFRHSFEFEDGPAITSAALRVVRDDGIVAYLNGTEVFRDNLPEGAILSSTPALAAVSGADEFTWLSAPVPVGLFTNGENVLAAEVHQVNGTSSDLSFNAELEVTRTILGPVIRTQPVSQSAAAGATIAFSVLADGTPPLSYQWRFQGQAIAGATQPVLNLVNLLSSQAGTYQVIVSNPAGNATSWDALLTIESSGLRLSVAGVSPDGGTLTLEFEAMAGRSYTLQSLPLLPGQTWSTADSVSPAVTNRTVAIDVPIGPPSRPRLPTPDRSPAVNLLGGAPGLVTS